MLKQFTVGGIDALNQIADPKASAAVMDSIIHQERSGCPNIMEIAINYVRRNIGLPPIYNDRSMGPGTLNAYIDLANNFDTKKMLLDAMYEKRVQWSYRHHSDYVDKDGKYHDRSDIRQSDRNRFYSLK